MPKSMKVSLPICTLAAADDETIKYSQVTGWEQSTYGRTEHFEFERGGHNFLSDENNWIRAKEIILDLFDT